MKHTPTPWRVKHLKGGTVFIQADRASPDHPYDIEIMGDDTNEVLYPDSQKEADAAFIVRACNSHDELVAIVQQYKADLQSRGADESWPIMQMIAKAKGEA